MSDNPNFTPSINSDSADFIPSQGDYKKLQPFRYWCQKVLPLVYDDSLSYYELLCKVVDYLNKTMEDVETLHGDIDDMYTAFGQLQNWTNTSIDDLRSDYQLLVSFVNDYFNNLDVQNEINNKLDAMASSGELTALLTPYVPNAVAAWLAEHITPTTPAVDNTLSVSGAAADAKVTGEKIKGVYTYIDTPPMLTDYFYQANTYIDGTNAEATLSNYDLFKIPVSYGDIIYITQPEGETIFWNAMGAQFVFHFLNSDSTYSPILTASENAWWDSTKNLSL